MRSRYAASTIALLYALLGGLWIVVSSTFLTFATSDPVMQGRLELFKGVAFVAATSGLLYLLLRDDAPDLDARDTQRGRGSLPLWFVVAVCVPLASLAVYAVQARENERAMFADLAAKATLKSDQVESWLAARRGESASLATSAGFVERVANYRASADADEESVIRDRLESVIHAYGYTAIGVFDPTGRRLLSYGQEHAVPDATLDLFAPSLADGSVRMSPILRDGDGELHLDFIAPLLLPEILGQREPIALVVLHVDPTLALFPNIQAWPAASESGEFMLVVRDSDSVLFLNELRHRKGTALSRRESLTESTLPAAAAVRSDQPGTVRGADYRGVDVLAAWRTIAGTEWRLVAKVDRTEALEGARATAIWVGVVTLFAVLLLAATLAALWRARRRADQLTAQSESDRMFKLFFDLPFIGMAITSPETKHWVRFNNELCVMLGYTRAELENLSWAQMTHPDDLDKDVAQFDRVMRGASDGYELDKRFVRKDGAVVYATIDVKCQRKPDGTVDFFLATIRDTTQTKLAERSLRESESRLRRAIESAPIPIMIHADDGEVVMLSQAWTEITGYALADIPTTRAWTERAYGERSPMVRQDIDRLYDATTVKEGEYTIRTRSGDTRVWSFMSTGLGLTADGRRLAISMAMDVTEGKLAQDRIEALLGMYATLSRCNEAIVRCEDEDDLFAQVCAAATEQGGLKLAWVGMVDEQGQVRPVASAGEGRAYLEGIVISLAEGEPSGQGPTGTSIRENRPYWCQDFASDPRTADWHERGARFGWGSSASMPLRRDGVAVGSFTLYADRVGMFDEPTQRLLTEMAADISFALDNFDREARREQAETTLLDQYEELRRWYRAMLNREERTLELKHEVNAVLRQLGQPPRYASVDDDAPASGAPEGDEQ